MRPAGKRRDEGFPNRVSARRRQRVKIERPTAWNGALMTVVIIKIIITIMEARAATARSLARLVG